MSTIFKIFIGNVNFKTTEEQLRALFEPHIKDIEDLVVARDPKTGRSKGYGFVMTHNHEEGRKALRLMGKPFIDGRRIYLKEAHGKHFEHRPRPNKGRRPYRKPRPRPHPQIHVMPQDRPFAKPPGRPGGYTGLDQDNRSTDQSGSQ